MNKTKIRVLFIHAIKVNLGFEGNNTPRIWLSPYGNLEIMEDKVSLKRSTDAKYPHKLII